MPYIVVEDFRGGLDTRRMNVTSTPGTLATLTNAHITRGGEIEKRPAFVPLTDLPSNTIGLAAAGGQIYVFGSEAPSSVTFAAGTPSNINYQQLSVSYLSHISKVLSVDFYNGKIYCAAQFSTGQIHHFYDGIEITDWFDGRARGGFRVFGGSLGGTAATASFQVTGGTSNPGDNLRVLRVNNVDIISSAVAHTGNNATTAANIVTAIGAGGSGYTASASGATVTITASAVGIEQNGYQLTFAVDGAVTLGSVTHMSGGLNNAVTDVTVNGVSIMGNQVNWNTSNSVTAAAIVDEINSYSSTPEFEAIASGEYVKIISKVSGSSFNNQPIVATTTGNANTNQYGSGILTGGADDSSDITTTPPGTYTPGPFVRPVKSKMYSLRDSLLHFSGVDQPTEWNDTNVGAGFINLANNAKGSEDLKAIANYFNNIAVLAEQCVQIWFVDPDDDLNQQIQVLGNTGTIAADSVVEFGDNDVFYLALSGIRSLRSRDSSNAAFVGDIGNPIDSLVAADIRSSRTVAEDAKATLEPRDGRYLIAIGSKIYVFSFFPQSKVSAWSVYEPGFQVNSWAYDGEQTLCRSGDKLYSLGGVNGDIYDNCTVTVQLPFLDAGSPATEKDLNGLDITCQNVWDVSIATDPSDITVTEDVATFSQTSYGLGRATMSGYSTHVAPKLVCTQSGAAKIGNVVIHYTTVDAG